MAGQHVELLVSAYHVGCVPDTVLLYKTGFVVCVPYCLNFPSVWFVRGTTSDALLLIMKTNNRCTHRWRHILHFPYIS